MHTELEQKCMLRKKLKHFGEKSSFMGKKTQGKAKKLKEKLKKLKEKLKNSRYRRFLPLMPTGKSHKKSLTYCVVKLSFTEYY